MRTFLSYDGPPRDHLANDLETLIAFLTPFALGSYAEDDGSVRDNDTVIWYDTGIVTGVLDDVTQRDFVTCVNVKVERPDDLALKILSLLEVFKIKDLVRVYHGRFSRTGEVKGVPAQDFPSSGAA